jgi:hypothetical protein
MIASGCVAAPMRVVEYRCGRTPAVVQAPLDCMYTLYAERHQRIESTTIAKGQPVGFIRSGAGLQAVIGNDRIPLAEGNYAWLAEFGPEQQENVALLGAGAIVAAVLLWPFSSPEAWTSLNQFHIR